MSSKTKTTENGKMITFDGNRIKEEQNGKMRNTNRSIGYQNKSNY